MKYGYTVHVIPLLSIPRPRPPKPPLDEGTPRSVFAGRGTSVVAIGFCFCGVSFFDFLPLTSPH
jgi:hypothetical protein